MDWNHLYNFGRVHHEELFCEIILNFDKWFRTFKDISYLEHWQLLCSAEQNRLCNFGRGYYEEQFCKIILNLGQWLRRCRLKDFLSGALAALLFSGAEPFMQFSKRASLRLPNGQMLNRWLSEKNNLSVFWLRFRGAKKVNKCCMFCIL